MNIKSSIDRLVDLHETNRAVLIQAEPGEGKEWLARQAIKAMGMEVYFFNLDACEPSDVDEGVKKVSESTKPMGIVFSGLDDVKHEYQAYFTVSILSLLREGRVVFMTARPRLLDLSHLKPIVGSVVDVSAGEIVGVTHV